MTAFLLFTMEHKHSAISYVIYLLAKREYSKFELQRKLKLKDYNEAEIEEAIQQAQRHNWQSDERFCAAYIRYRAQQGYGPRRLKQELYQRGITDGVIRQEMDNAEIDWFELAEKLFEKKRPLHWDLKAKQKMWRYMLSHGFYNEHFSHLMELNYDEYE